MTENTNNPVPPTPTPAPGWAAGDGSQRGFKKPSGLALAGAGSVLAALAFLGGTAVGHAWGSGSSGTEQTQFGGPGGRVRQFPGTQPGTQQQDPNQQTPDQQTPDQQLPGQTRTS
ncbi:hypothetical protein [Kribbella sp. ALI-6-A]|uniref:hypothetical protein n=1 Tax=Kribbella sp. ALI-6-A TaxID=1933817 RepID=UPI00117B5706|nr:hypothetical protein [Kribbella sp. ALI-6-A]